jgi:membrane-associated phospholipid phosphatase
MLKIIGEYFPYIVIIVSLYFIPPILLLSGVAINSFINFVLKNLIRAKRPIPSMHSDYGMPSGHCQTASFVTTMLYFYNFRAFVFACVFSFITMWQRVHYRHHYLSQVIVGTLLGVIIAYVFKKKAAIFRNM